MTEPEYLIVLMGVAIGEATVLQWSRKVPSVPNDCTGCQIRHLTLCEPLKDQQLQIVRSYKSGDRILARGTQLYDQGENCSDLFNLLDGWVALYRMLPSGRFQILDFAVPGYFLGYQPDLQGPMCHGAVCLTDVAVCVFPRRDFHSLLATYPTLGLRLSHLIWRDAAIAQSNLANVGSRAALSRVAHLLLELRQRLRLSNDDSLTRPVELPLTQQNIADALGLTAVRVSQSLRKLRESNLAVFKKGRLTVLDPQGLVALAEFEELVNV